MNYNELAALSNIYLEDSYVLSIFEREHSLVLNQRRFLMRVIPDIKTAGGRKVLLQKDFSDFINVESIEWLDRKFMAYSDASSELDYGNIDIFLGCNGGYALAGDWGQLVIKGQDIDVVIEY